MRAEIHFKLDFSKEIDYKQFLGSFLLKGWEIFPKNGRNIIIDVGDDDDFITVDNQSFFYEILKRKSHKNQKLGFSLFYENNEFMFIIKENEITGWSFEKNIYKDAENPDFRYCAKILTESFIDNKDFISIRISIESSGGEYDSVIFSKSEIIDLT